MNLLKRSDTKKTGFGSPEPSNTNWFAIVLLGAAGLLLCFLLYALLSPLLFGSDPEYEIVPYGSGDDTATTPPTFTAAAVASSTPLPTQLAATPAPTQPITTSSAAQLTQYAQLAPISAEVSSVVFAPNGTLIAAASYDGTVRVWDVASLLPLHAFQSDSNRVNSIAFAPDSSRIVAGGQDTVVRVWSLSTGTETRLTGPNAAVRSVTFSPDGTQIAAASDDGVVYVWDATVDPPALAKLLSGHTSYVTSVAFAPDGTTIAAGGEDDTIRLWNVNTGTQYGVLQGHTATVTSVVFSPDGLSLASTSADKSVRVWNVLSESVVAVLQGHTENVNDAAFSRDGLLLVTAGSGIEDNTARFWNASSGEQLRMPLSMTGPLNSVAFTPDGTLLATGGATYLTLWYVNATETVQSIIPTALPTALTVSTANLSGQGGALTCTLTVRSDEANMRSGPSTDYSVGGTLTLGATVQAAGWAQDTEGYTWWLLLNNLWTRGDAFISTEYPSIPDTCLQLPAATAPAVTTGVTTTSATATPGIVAPTSAPVSATGSDACVLTVRSDEANMRSGPSTDYGIGGTLTVGQTAQATGWARDVEGYTWWLLSNGLWTRGDAFISTEYASIADACLQLPAADVPDTAASEQTTGTTQAITTSACVLTVRREQVTTYTGPDTVAYTTLGTLTSGQTVQATGWAQDDEGFTWWVLSGGAWARGDSFLDAANPSLPDTCLTLPQATAP